MTDSLPDEPGGYSGFQAVFGHKYLQPLLAKAATSGDNRMVNGNSYPVTDTAGNLVDLNGNEIDGEYVHTPGFPGFGPISAAQSLAYVADMQEVGIPVTYAYISDAHESKPGQTGCSNSGRGPRAPATSATSRHLAADNKAFTTFFQRLADDGITPHNTLFVFSSDEGDHFAGANVGRALTPSCTGTPDYDQLLLLLPERDDRRAGRRHPRPPAEPARGHDAVLQRAPGRRRLHHRQPRPDQCDLAPARA